MKKIFRVVAQSQPQAVTRKDGTQTQKCSLCIQELGGRYENSYVATMLGNMASLKFYQNELVYAVLRFESREYQGNYFMDCVCQDIVKISTSNAF